MKASLRTNSKSGGRAIRSMVKRLIGRLSLMLLGILLLVSTTMACVGGTLPIPGISSGGVTLNLADTGPITLDPATAAEATSASYIFQLYSGLARIDEMLQVVPEIAKSWDKSPDGKTFTFHLRTDAKFQDGTPIKASDFKYSWERALSPSTQSLTAGTYLNDIVGAAEVISGKTTQLTGVKVVDDLTLQVAIDAPKAYFLEKMAYPTSFVVDRSNVGSGSDWWQHPNGSGPFKLQQWQKDQIVVLQRNDNYYGEKAKVDQVVYQLYSGNPLDLYQQGKIDVAQVPSVYMGLVTDPTNPISKELKTTPELSFYYLGFNAAVPPFDDAKVRQAFSYAVDKDRVISLSLQNVVVPAYGALPPGMPGYNASLQGLRFDPEKARQLIAGSKYGDVSKLPPIVLTTSGYAGEISGTLGGILAEWRRNLGVEVSVRQLEPSNYLYSLNQERDQVWDNGWIADYPDPQDFLDMLFHTGAQNNTGGYTNKQFDTLLDSAAVEQDPALRMKMYQDAEQMVVQDAAVLPLSFGRNYMLVKPYVSNYIQSPLGYPLLNKASVQR
jgi:oligopeptide transport system substrate-binding protein